MRTIQQGESVAVRRRVYFQIVGTDGLTPATGEAGGQPQISTNGGAWAATGIGVLVEIGNGRYYAELTAAALAAVGDVIETRYASGSTAECPGDSVQVFAHDLAAATFGVSGSGAIAWTYTLTSSVDATPLDAVAVWVTSDALGANVLAIGQTNSAGQVTFFLDAGTVYVWRQRSGYSFANPDTEVVS
jgi:hypothetical protein